MAPALPNGDAPGRRNDLGIAALLTLCFLAVYGVGAATTVQGADAAEFMLIAGGGGLAHPPGYPLFSTMVRLFHHVIPWGSAAWHASLSAAALGAAAVGVTYLAVAQLTRQPLAAITAACSIGFFPSFWQYATVSEVFTGGVLTFALLAWCVAAIDGGRLGTRAGAALLGAACGLGTAHHHTLVLAAPLAAWGGWLLWRRARSTVHRVWVTLILMGGLFSTMATNLLSMLPGGNWRWGHTETWTGLLRHLLRSDYGTTKIAAQSSFGHVGSNIEAWAFALLVGFMLTAGVGLLGLAAGLHRRQWRGYTVALTLSLLLTGPVFVSMFGLDPVGMAKVLLARFYVFSAGLFAIAIGLGAAVVLARTGRAGLVLVAALIGLQLARSHQQNLSHRGWTVLDDYLRSSLSALEPDCLLVVSDDYQVFPLLYLQEIEGLRPDVTVVAAGMLGFPWYRDRISARDPTLRLDGAAIGGFNEDRSVPALVEENLPLRPVYMSFGLAGRPAIVEGVPAMAPSPAIVMRVYGDALPPPWEVESDLREALAHVDLKSGPVTNHQWAETWEAEAWRQYGIAIEALGAAWRAQGSPEQADRCDAAATAFWNG